LIMLSLSSLVLLLSGGFKNKFQIDPYNVGFNNGEKLVYRVHFSIFNGGEAIITTDREFHKIGDKDCYKVNVFGMSTGAVRRIFPVRDNWRSYMDKETLLPQKFYRSIEEGKYIIRETTFFDHSNKSARVVRRDKDGKLDRDSIFGIEENSFDIVSGIFAIRAMDFSLMSPGYKFPMTAFFEDSTYTLEIKYLGREKIRTKFGKIYSHVFTPLLPGNDLFEDGENTITVFFSDTPGKIPLKIRAEMFVGAVECDLKEYSNVIGDLN
jgi:Protein of unknown function (DUF3108)